MATIRLNISDHLYDEFMQLLTRFRPEDVKVIDESMAYQDARDYVTKELERLNAGNSKTYSLEDAERILNESISKYENPSDKGISD